MSHDQYEMYAELRKANLIGKLWSDGGAYKLAPVDALPGLEYMLADSIAPETLYKLIESTFTLHIRKPPAAIVESKPKFKFGPYRFAQ